MQTLKQSVRKILKTNNVVCFSFQVLCPSSCDFKSEFLELIYNETIYQLLPTLLCK